MAKQVRDHQENYWKFRINVDAILGDLGLRPAKMQGDFYLLNCPLHSDVNASLEIAPRLIQRGDETFEPGYWCCFGGCGKGDIALLRSKMLGCDYTQAKRQIIEKHCPEMLVITEGKGKPGKQMANLPSDAALGLWITQLKESPPFMEYVTKARGIAVEVMEKARLGENRIGHVTMPVYAADGKTLLNCRLYAATKEARDRGEPKIKGISGRGFQVYPMWMVTKEARRRVFAEGEWDALILHSIGETETLTTTGGTGTLKTVVLDEWYPTGPGSEVIICFDNDDAGRTATRKLASELQREGVETVTMVKLPDGQKDITDYLTSIPEDKRVEAWKKLLGGGTKRNLSNVRRCGLVAENGCLVNEESGEIVATFTGQVVSSGIPRFGFGEPTRMFTVELTNRDGKSKLLVNYDYCHEEFADAVQRTAVGGALWTVEKRAGDKVFNWLAAAGADTEVKRDVGFCWGFDTTIVGPDQFRCYYTPNVLFKDTGPVPNNEIVMSPPAEFLRKMDLPFPEPEKVHSGLRVTFEHAYFSHAPSAMAPLLAVTFMSPVFRALWQNEARFPTLLYGRSGCGKTTRSIIALSYFGHFRSTNDLVTLGGRNGSGSTYNSVATMQALAGDSVFIIDDIGFSRTTDEKQREALVDFLQSQSQGLGRTRMTGSGKLLSANVPRGLPIISTEILPSEDESQVARTFLVNMPSHIDMRSEPYLSNYQACFDYIDDRHHAMAGWIDWNVSSPQAGIAFNRARAEVKPLIEEAASKIAPKWRNANNAPRIVGRWVSVTEAWWMLLAFAYEKGSLTANDVERFKAEWINDVVPSNLFQALAFLAQSGHKETFLSGVAMALQGAKACLTMQHSGMMIPSTAPNTATIIGFCNSPHNLDDGIEDAISYCGQPIVVFLSSSSATALGVSRGSVQQWKTTLQFLKASDYVSKVVQTNSKVVRLSKKGAMELLDWMPGVSPTVLS